MEVERELAETRCGQVFDGAQRLQIDALAVAVQAAAGRRLDAGVVAGLSVVVGICVADEGDGE